MELRTTTDIYKFKELPVTVRLFEFWVYPYWREHRGRKEKRALKEQRIGNIRGNRWELGGTHEEP